MLTAGRGSHTHEPGGKIKSFRWHNPSGKRTFLSGKDADVYEPLLRRSKKYCLTITDLNDNTATECTQTIRLVKPTSVPGECSWWLLLVPLCLEVEGVAALQEGQRQVPTNPRLASIPRHGPTPWLL